MNIDYNLKYKISLLPRELQKKIYIFVWKFFWRNYVPLTAKIPSWQIHHNNTQKILWEARVNNIHFFHLPFNTLPENKKWILGCQCDFCQNTNEISEMEKRAHTLIQSRNSSYFPDVLMPNESHSLWNENIVWYWKSLYHNITIMGKIFNPLFNTYKDKGIYYKLRNNIQINFNYPF